MAAPDALDNQTELAKERNRIAADRTLLTWIRASISFISIGFGISKIINFLALRDQIQFSLNFDLDLIGLVVIGLGVFIVIAAILEYQKEVHRLHQTFYIYNARPSLGLIVGGAVMILAIFSLVVVWIEPLSP